MSEEKKEGFLDNPPDEESKEIVEQIAKEKADEAKSKGDGAEPEPEKEKEKPKEPESEAKKPDKKEPDENADAGDGKPGEGEEEEKKRKPKLMEVFKHKIAQKDWEKKENDFVDQIDKLKVQLESKKSTPDQDKKIKEFVEKTGMEEDIVRGLMDLMPRGESVPQDIKKEIADLKEEKERLHQEQEFSKDYAKTVLPLAKQDEVLEDKRDDLKDYVNKMAFTQKYSSYELDDLYLKLKRKGELDDFFKKEGKKSAENTRVKPHGQAGDDKKKGWMEMSDEEFEKESEARGEKESKFEIRRDGEVI